MNPELQKLFDHMRDEELARREKMKNRKVYKKPDSIKKFEEAYYIKKLKERPNTQVKDRFSDKTANELQKLIVKFFEYKGASYATRLNSTGIYRADIKKYVRSTQKNGLSDVQALCKGTLWMIEVKIGRDKPSDDQLKRQKEVRADGGVYEFVHSLDELLEVFKQNVK